MGECYILVKKGHTIETGSGAGLLGNSSSGRGRPARCFVDGGIGGISEWYDSD